MRFKNLGRYRTGGTLRNMELSVPLPRTPSGKVYRFSPNEAAHPRHFVLGGHLPDFRTPENLRPRMKFEPGSNQTVCPYSGTVADDDAFTHADDREAALKMVEHAAFADAEAEFSRIFEDFGRSLPKSGPLQVTTTKRRTSRPKPRFFRRDLLRELACDHCGREYGVYAIALFCPDCGAPNLRLHFAREVHLVEEQVALAEARSVENQELAYRLLGNAHEDVLTAFEATLKTVYRHATAKNGAEVRPVRNDFQNIEISRKRFSELGFDPFGGLDQNSLDALQLNIQKRHVIGHNLGVVDSRFAEHAADARLGETVQLVGKDIRAFAVLSQRVVDALDSWLAGVPFDEQPRGDTFQEAAGAEEEAPGDNLARRVALWFAGQSERGLEDLVDAGQISSQFGDVAPDELAEALAELEADGYISTVAGGRQIPHVQLLLDLFVEFDPRLLGTDPVADSCALIEIVLKGEDFSVSAEALHEQTGWPLRRFNPAYGLVVAQVDERRVSKEITSGYPARYFHLDAADRVALKRYLAQTGGGAG